MQAVIPYYIFLIKMAVQSQCAPSERRQVSNLVRASVLSVCDNEVLVVFSVGFWLELGQICKNNNHT